MQASYNCSNLNQDSSMTSNKVSPDSTAPDVESAGSDAAADVALPEPRLITRAQAHKSEQDVALPVPYSFPETAAPESADTSDPEKPLSKGHNTCRGSLDHNCRRRHYCSRKICVWGGSVFLGMIVIALAVAIPVCIYAPVGCAPFKAESSSQVAVTAATGQ